MRTAKACCRLESKVRWRGEAMEGSDIWRAANGECRLAIGGSGDWRWRVMSGDTGDGRMANGALRRGLVPNGVSCTSARVGDQAVCDPPAGSRCAVAAPYVWVRARNQLHDETM